MSDPITSRSLAKVSALEDDLVTYSELILKYGPLPRLVKIVNEERASLGLGPFGEGDDD